MLDIVVYACAHCIVLTINICRFAEQWQLSPTAKPSRDLKRYRFLGQLIGVALRTNTPLALDLCPTVWIQVCESVRGGVGVR